mgnify:FL=1
MKRESKSYQELFSELTEYEKSGIRMHMDGRLASPLQIVSAHMIRETNNYMRDYVMDENGKLKELDFYEVAEKKETEERKTTEA